MESKTKWTNDSILAFVDYTQSRCLTKAISTLPNAGYGLFTMTSIPQGYLFAEYTGIITGKEQLQQRYGSYTAPYAIAVMEKNGKDVKHYIDALHPDRSSIARYANDSRDKKRNNAEFEQYGDRVYLKTTKPIAAGEEIFVFYGSYWASKPGIELEQELVEVMIAEHVMRFAHVSNTVADTQTVTRWTCTMFADHLIAKYGTQHAFWSKSCVVHAITLALKHKSMIRNGDEFYVNVKSASFHMLRSVFQLNNLEFKAKTKKRMSHFLLSKSKQ